MHAFLEQGNKLTDHNISNSSALIVITSIFEINALGESNAFQKDFASNSWQFRFEVVLILGTFTFSYP